MLVKICGIKTAEAAQTAVHAGADFIGFVFAPSKREITPNDAAAIAKTIPASTKKVGVFVNESLENIKRIATHVRLDYIQLHGDESPEFAAMLNYPIIKAVPMRSETINEIKKFPCAFYLIDSPTGTNRGGNGTTFDWNLLTEANLDPGKVILAGGLNPDNVQEAMAAARPAGVDVSSGVETDGQKDLAKIKAFIRTAKRKDDLR
ncbi:phosphoribosylanthranilate isomerase [Virgibacillus oceani]|uniref:N-(5'-phosphoribosyl)anthranilate isomerase n=1 Tax=Virgibacillus oceani TaxID=1479511 RepID=A0A917HJW0_9BACI|nr:phosphoribosylanthranilate isomerase [Virgibacillus oceani]GGG81032.1 N-(5'-phosphoribosyl)anthranilate isomerase [Virgibacillus oceani]